MSTIEIISALLRAVALGWAAFGFWRLRDIWLATVVGLLAASLVPAVIGLGDAGSLPVGRLVAELSLSAAALVAVILIVRTVEAHKKLKREASLLEQVFHHSPEAIALFDRKDRVLRGNAAFVRMFGYSAEEVRGKSVQDLIVPPDRTSDGELLRRALAAGETASTESVRQRKDGTQLPVSITRTPIRAE